MNTRYMIITAAVLIFFMMITVSYDTAAATEVVPIAQPTPEESAEVGTDEYGNTTVLYNDHLYTEKSNGWYIRATYIYDGTDLDAILDARVAGTRYTSTRYEGFLFVRMSGGWYRHELHIKNGTKLDKKLDEIAGKADEKEVSTDIAPTITGR